MLNRESELIVMSNDRHSSTERKKSKFIPLGALLTKNHEDRVKDYLLKMEGLSLDDIVKSGTLPQAAPIIKRK